MMDWWWQKVLRLCSVHTSVDEFPASITSGQIIGALIDSYVASEHQSVLSPFRLQSIIEHVSSNGIVFQNNGFGYDTCIRDYILSRQEEVYRIIQKRIKPIKVCWMSKRGLPFRLVFTLQIDNFFLINGYGHLWPSFVCSSLIGFQQTYQVQTSSKIDLLQFLVQLNETYLCISIYHLYGKVCPSVYACLQSIHLSRSLWLCFRQDGLVNKF